jgi:hypothetical protein
MATLLQATDLVTLDRKWREPGKLFSFRPSLKPRRSGSPGTATRPISEFPELFWRFAHRKGVVLGASVGVVAAGAAVALAMRRPMVEPSLPPVIMVEGSVAAVGFNARPPPPPTNSSAAAASNPAEVLPPPSPSAPSSNAARTSAPKSRSELLTRAFARQQPQIARCFSQYASEISGNPEISVHFDVKADGRVLSAQIQPAALAATPLGGCIAGVARATEFGPQPQPTQFRIPITAKRGP